MMPSIVAKKIFKSAHHARRRIKNQFPVIFVASVIKLKDVVKTRVNNGRFQAVSESVSELTIQEDVVKRRIKNRRFLAVSESVLEPTIFKDREKW